MNAFVAGVTAAAVGAITGATFILGRRGLDVPTAAIALLTYSLLMSRRLPEPLLILPPASSVSS